LGIKDHERYVVHHFFIHLWTFCACHRHLF
jgi:hypothetical protein